MRPALLKRIVLAFLLGGIAYFLASPSLSGKRGLAGEGASLKKIDQLIEELKSDRLETREAATQALKEMVEAIPALSKARASSDPEVRRRVEAIQTVLGKKQAAHSLAKVRALAKEGRAVEIADRLAFAARTGASGVEGWEGLTRVSEKLIFTTNYLFPPSAHPGAVNLFPAGEFSRYAKLVNPLEIAQAKINIDTGKRGRANRDAKARADQKVIRETKGKFLLRGDEISLMGDDPLHKIDYGMMAASGEIRVSGAMQSVLAAGGDAKEVSNLMFSILICDGDVELLGMPIDSLIIARGKIVCKDGVRPLQRCVVRSGGHTYLYGHTEYEFKDKPDPLAFVKFFELADVGLTAEDLPPAEKRNAPGVLLKDVSKESPFAAGLRRGDVITAVDEKKSPTTEIFRRVLRRKLAEGGPALIFTVRRSGKTLEVSIPIKD